MQTQKVTIAHDAVTILQHGIHAVPSILNGTLYSQKQFAHEYPSTIGVLPSNGYAAVFLINRINVPKKARKKGCGSELIDTVMSLKNLNHHLCVLYCDDDVVDFYRKNGFTAHPIEGDPENGFLCMRHIKPADLDVI